MIKAEPGMLESYRDRYDLLDAARACRGRLTVGDEVDVVAAFTSTGHALSGVLRCSTGQGAAVVRNAPWKLRIELD